MSIKVGIFGDEACVDQRYIPDHEKLEELVKYWKGMGLRIVLASGTWDLFHVGHARYLEKAKAEGDLLIVGVDSDEKVKQRKGPNRPVVPDEERIALLSHIRHVDVITLKQVSDGRDALIRMIRPDVLVISDSTGHTEKELLRKQKHCGKVVRLESQATTSTTAKVRLLHVGGASQFAEHLIPRFTELIERLLVDNSRHLAEQISAQIPAIVHDALTEIRK